MNKGIWCGLVAISAAVFFGGACETLEPTAPEVLSVDAAQPTDVVGGNPVVYDGSCSEPAALPPPQLGCGQVDFSVDVTDSGSPIPAVGATVQSSNDAVLNVGSVTGADFPVTAVAPGAADVLASYQGLTAAKTIRVMPWYSGAYPADVQVKACTATGEFLMIDACTSGEFFEVGDFVASPFVANQTADQVNANFDLGGGVGLVLPGNIAVDGSLSAPGPVSSNPLSNGLIFEVSAFSLSMRFSGGHYEVFGGYSLRTTAQGVNGDVIYDVDVLPTVRSFPLATSGVSRTFGQAMRSPFSGRR